MDREPGAFADFVAIKATNVFPLKAGVPDEQAVMVEPLANGVHLFSLIERHQFGTLAIYGAGTQGILMLALARLLGYRDIAIVDTNRARLDVAGQLGVARTIDPHESEPAVAIREWTGGRGVDIGIDAVGSTVVRQSLVHATRKGGEIIMPVFGSLVRPRAESQLRALQRFVNGIGPSTWGMMIIGFAGIGFMAYRRKHTGQAFRLG